MPHIGIRISEEMKDEIKRRATLTSRTVSDYVVDLINADIDNIESEEDDLWITHVAHNFELSIKQIKHAIDTLPTAAEAIAQIGAKSKWYKVFINYEGEDLEVQIESTTQNNEIYVMSSSRRQTKMNIIRDVFKSFDSQIAGGAK